MSELIIKTNAQEMKWIIMIILKGERNRLLLSLTNVSFSVPFPLWLQFQGEEFGLYRRRASHCPRYALSFYENFLSLERLRSRDDVMVRRLDEVPGQFEVTAVNILTMHLINCPRFEAWN